jgi:hypothetical protein
MHDVLGPVTVVTGKKQRLTLIECPCDMNAMVDLSKVLHSRRAALAAAPTCAGADPMPWPYLAGG